MLANRADLQYYVFERFCLLCKYLNASIDSTDYSAVMLMYHNNYFCSLKIHSSLGT